jgi:transposase
VAACSPRRTSTPRGCGRRATCCAAAPFWVRRHAEALVHRTNTNSQYNRPPFAKKLAYAANHAALDLAERFDDPSVRQNVELDLTLVATYDDQISALELYRTRTAKVDDPQAFHRLRSVPGIGKVLALVLLYEIHDIRRFPRSAATSVRPARRSTNPSRQSKPVHDRLYPT